MSRIGNAPITVPSGVTVTISEKNVVTVKGPKGELKQTVDPAIKVALTDGVISVERPTNNKLHRSLHGTYRAIISNMITGVSTGFKLEQELVGVGYRATAKGQVLELALGYSHAIAFELPSEIKLTTVAEKGKNPMIVMESFDNQLLGQVAAKIRSLRKPEPYKGKGIKFTNEVVRRKAGKSSGKK
ncbi:MAG TPA: 50S ribosomal protein L6 [Luteibaculaceae bacterium]|nr:50S ribosomal protein L6 [Luteibaculaceae bacterium]